MKNTNKEYILYILVRNDLPSLNPGKAMAQVIHAGHIFSATNHKTQAYIDWAEARGFGTTVTLSADERTIDKLVDSVPTPQSGWIVDPTYPLIAPADVLGMIDLNKLSEVPHITNDGKNVVLCRKEKTCAYLFGDKEILQQWTYNLPMYQ